MNGILEAMYGALLFNTLPTIPHVCVSIIPYIASTIPYIAYYTIHCLL